MKYNFIAYFWLHQNNFILHGTKKKSQSNFCYIVFSLKCNLFVESLFFFCTEKATASWENKMKCVRVDANAF